MFGTILGYRACRPVSKPAFKKLIKNQNVQSLRKIHASAAAEQRSRFAIDKDLLDREWLIKDPSAPITHVREGGSTFRVLRDDLTHPFIGGNKRRKLDAVFPEYIKKGITDVVTCGGSQSAHVLAVAAAAAEHGIKSHLLIRGERPAVPTGNHLFARMHAFHVKYVPRIDYADRTTMFEDYVKRHHLDLKRTAILPEGGAEITSLLGQIRLIDWLSKTSIAPDEPCTLIIDSGTGTSAVGLALGAALLNLPWTVLSVMLAGPLAYYEQQSIALTSAFAAQHGLKDMSSDLIEAVNERLYWVERFIPRRFGKVLPGEIQRCHVIARDHGILVDPIWTLSSWEMAEHKGRDGRNVVMVHTGGALGLCGLAQRWPEDF